VSAAEGISKRSKPGNRKKSTEPDNASIVSKWRGQGLEFESSARAVRARGRAKKTWAHISKGLEKKEEKELGFLWQFCLVPKRARKGVKGSARMPHPKKTMKTCNFLCGWSKKEKVWVLGR